MNSKVTIKVPDALILEQDTSLMVNSSMGGNTLRSWAAGAVITDPADIARLERANVPRQRYELIPDDPSPTPPGEEQLEHELDEVAA